MIYSGIEVSSYDALFRDRCAIRRLFRHPLNPLGSEQLISPGGGLSGCKGRWFVVDAPADVPGWRPDDHFVFAGDGDACSVLEGPVARRDFSGFFLFLGFRDDVPAILTASEALVRAAEEQAGNARASNQASI